MIKHGTLLCTAVLGVWLAACGSDPNKNVQSAEANRAENNQEASTTGAELQQKHAEEQSELARKQHEENAEHKGDAHVQNATDSKDVHKAQADMVETRRTYEAKAKERLTKLDAKAKELETKVKAAPAAKRTAASTPWNSWKTQRAEVGTRMTTVSSVQDAQFDGFSKDTDNKLDSLEKALDEVQSKL